MQVLSNLKNTIEYAKSKKTPEQILSPYQDLIKSLSADGVKLQSKTPHQLAITLHNILISKLHIFQTFSPYISYDYINLSIDEYMKCYGLDEDDATINLIIEELQKTPIDYYMENKSNSNNSVFILLHVYDVDSGFGDAVQKEEVLGYTKSIEDAEEYIQKYSNPFVYDVPYHELEKHRIIYRELSHVNMCINPFQDDLDEDMDDFLDEDE